MLVGENHSKRVLLLQKYSEKLEFSLIISITEDTSVNKEKMTPFSKSLTHCHPYSWSTVIGLPILIAQST